jgi:hypothetical protein
VRAHDGASVLMPPSLSDRASRSTWDDGKVMEGADAKVFVTAGSGVGERLV